MFVRDCSVLACVFNSSLLVHVLFPAHLDYICSKPALAGKFNSNCIRYVCATPVFYACTPCWRYPLFNSRTLLYSEDLQRLDVLSEQRSSIEMFEQLNNALVHGLED